MDNFLQMMEQMEIIDGPVYGYLHLSYGYNIANKLWLDVGIVKNLLSKDTYNYELFISGGNVVFPDNTSRILMDTKVTTDYLGLIISLSYDIDFGFLKSKS